VSYNVGGLAGGPGPAVGVLGPLRADVVLVQDAPWRLRWRTPVASLAAGLGLVYAGGGRDSAGTVVLVKIRVDVDAVTPMLFPLVAGQLQRGAVLARGRVADTPFTVASARLADTPPARAQGQAALAQALGGVTGALLVAGDIDRVAGLTDAVDPAPGQPRMQVGPGVQVDGVELGPPGPRGCRPVAVDLIIG
jgi:hypothetical protein